MLTDTFLFVTGMAPGKIYPIEISAVNEIGPGPAGSAPLQLDASIGLYEGAMTSSYENDDMMGDVMGYTWLIALLGSLLFVLMLISAVMFYYRKRHSGIVQKSMGYLAANTNDVVDFHCQQLDVQSLSGSKRQQQQQQPATLHHQPIGQQQQQQPLGGQPGMTGSQPLWIDRRWNGGDYEKDSNSSEKKLLGGGNVPNHSDNEYAYIDRRGLSTFHGGGNSANNSNSSSTYENGHQSPEPYATTDILRQQKTVSFVVREYLFSLM